MLAGAFESLGVAAISRHCLTAKQRPDEAIERAIANATCIVLLASDPQALAQVIAGSTAERELHRALAEREACVVAIGGAASALSRCLVREGTSDIHPREGLISLAPGLAFLDRVVIDHHFSEKQRMGRLLSIVAQAPEYLGVGIDAHTALVLVPDRGLEVVGRATVTVLDGRAMSYCSLGQQAADAILAMGNVQLHLLPQGFTFDLEKGLPPLRGTLGPKVPQALGEVVSVLVAGP